MAQREEDRQKKIAEEPGMGTGVIPAKGRILSWVAVALVLAALGAYVLAGVATVPFHPDETTWLYMSSDLGVLLQGRVANLCYQPGKTPDGKVLERLRTAGLPRYVIGVADFLLGVPGSAVRADWNWSLSWEGNAEAGAVPGSTALFAGRLAMALAVVLALVLVFGMGTQLGGRSAGLLAAVAFGSNALVLLHGRRAMSEGLLLLTTSLAAWAAMKWSSRPAAQGGALGLAAAAKHTGFAILPVSLASLLWGAESQARSGPRGPSAPAPRQPGARWPRSAVGAGVILVTSIAVFGLFNPVGWCHPVSAVSAAFAERGRLLTAQTQMLSQAIPDEVVLTPRARLVALVNQTFFAPPAFWDIPNYAAQTAGQEQAYLAAIWGGLPRTVGLGTAALFLVLLGLAYSLRTVGIPWRRRGPAAREGEGTRRAMVLLIVWTGSTALAILVALPIQWQRYYVPLLPEISLLEALGLVALGKFAAALCNRRVQEGGPCAGSGRG
ncbi:MAG: hypothetical protein ABSB61_00775 [Anaerolineales bacterium]